MKCHQCKKKITLVETTIGTCKCKFVFCTLHRLPEDHECIYNHHEETKIIPKSCIAKKVSAI